MTDNQPDIPTMVLFLAHSIACHKIAESSNKTPKEVAFELNAEAQFMIESNKISPKQLDEFMRRVVGELET